jgi:hypothetical protein
MDKATYQLVVDTPQPNVLSLELVHEGRVVSTHQEAWQGHVDNILLTVVDNFLKRNTLDASALDSVQLGQGIDNNSALCRIIQSFAGAIAVAHRQGQSPTSE